MSVLLQRILELERSVHKLRQSLREMRASRDMWKHRAMSAERDRPRKRVAA